MKEANKPTGDAALGALLRKARPSPALPARFPEGVWRRIEEAGAPEGSASWLDLLAAWILRPRFAVAAAVVLIIAGAALGARQGNRLAQMGARTQYLSAVEPASLR